jgi:hypothetical protein
MGAVIPMLKPTTCMALRSQSLGRWVLSSAAENIVAKKVPIFIEEVMAILETAIQGDPGRKEHLQPGS